MNEAIEGRTEKLNHDLEDAKRRIVRDSEYHKNMEKLLNAGAGNIYGRE
jgi:hypothetical protein